MNKEKDQVKFDVLDIFIDIKEIINMFERESNIIKYSKINILRNIIINYKKLNKVLKD
jgi:hypothetical protein